MKWVTPFSPGVSSREPRRSHTPRQTERNSDISSVRRVIPLGRICLRILPPMEVA